MIEHRSFADIDSIAAKLERDGKPVSAKAMRDLLAERDAIKVELNALKDAVAEMGATTRHLINQRAQELSASRNGEV